MWLLAYRHILGILSSYLLVHIELPEDLRCVQQMLVLKDPVTVSTVLIPWYSPALLRTSFRSMPTEVDSGSMRSSIR